MDANTAGQENFSLPHDVLMLPSQGKFYKNKKKSVKVGYLTASDENNLMNIKKGDSQSIVNALVRNKLYEPDLKPEDMLDGDLEAILVFLRNTSFGPKYKISLLDPADGKRFDTEIDLSELDFRKSNTEPNQDGHFETVLPKSNVPVKLKLLTFGEEIRLNKELENYPVGLTAPVATHKLLSQIVEVNGMTDKGEIAKFIEKMPIMDSKFIRNFLEENEPRLDLTKQVISPSGEKVSTKITFGVEFFRPFF